MLPMRGRNPVNPLGLAVMALIACGGRAIGEGGLGGSGGTGQPPPPVGTQPTTTASGTSKPGTTVPAPSSSGSSVPTTPIVGPTAPPPTSGADAGCGPNILTAAVGSGFADCWDCAARECTMQIVGCANDCACNGAIAGALACADSGAPALSCFAPVEARGGVAGTALLMCLLKASSACSCMTPTNPPSPPPPACTLTGSGGTNGSGTCTSQFGETCGSTNYQVVCGCPQGTCVCFGDTTTVVKFDGCPSCPAPVATSPGATTSQELFKLCGFPQ
jgi:hypothetical protein